MASRYDYGVNKAKLLTNEELKELEKKGLVFSPKSLETLYEEHMETQPPEDDYEIVRGPRPWEDHPQKEQALANKKIKTVKTAGSYGL